MKTSNKKQFVSEADLNRVNFEYLRFRNGDKHVIIYAHYPHNPNKRVIQVEYYDDRLYPVTRFDTHECCKPGSECKNERSAARLANRFLNDY